MSKALLAAIFKHRDLYARKTTAGQMNYSISY
jgi:hypothetical protein